MIVLLYRTSSPPRAARVGEDKVRITDTQGIHAAALRRDTLYLACPHLLVYVLDTHCRHHADVSH